MTRRQDRHARLQASMQRNRKVGREPRGIVSRITLYGNAVNFKAANSELRSMLRMP